jgi:hypothetical protein
MFGGPISSIYLPQSDFDFLDNRSDAFFIIRSAAVGRKMAAHGLRG